MNVDLDKLEDNVVETSLGSIRYRTKKIEPLNLCSECRQAAALRRAFSKPRSYVQHKKKYLHSVRVLDRRGGRGIYTRSSESHQTFQATNASTKMSSIQLTAGICKVLASPSMPDDVMNSTPTVQLLSVKKVVTPNNGTPIDRYRIIVSDGDYFFQAMLATQLNPLVEEDKIGKNSIVRIDKFTCNLVQDRRLLIILEMVVLEKDHPKIGKPQNASPNPAGGEGSASAQETPASVTATSPPQTASSSHALTPMAQQTRQPQSTGSTTRPPDRRHTIPIEGLSPYQNNWQIKARVTHKSEIKTWSNQRGEGKLFNVTLMDESGEIRATGFNQALDELYDKFEEGKVYYISKAKVNLAKKQFSTVNNEYELGLEKHTEVEECRETGEMPSIRYNFVTIGEIQGLQKDSICDIVAVVKEVGPLGDITTKFGKKSMKRDLTLVDRSNYSIRLTLWGKQAEQYNEEGNPVIAIKGAKVGDFGGRNLSTYSSSLMTINPDIPDAHMLRGWYDAGGHEGQFQSHSTGMSSSGGVKFNRDEVQSLADINQSVSNHPDIADKPFFCSCRATVMHIKTENFSYPACPSAGCNKKVFEQHDGWRCEKCDKSYEKPEYRYILHMAVSDYSGQAWVQGFNDAGEAVFHRTANELVEIKDRDEAKFNKIVDDAVGQTFNLTCKIKQESFNDIARLRYAILKINPINYEEEAEHLLTLLNSPWAQ
ncbi:replication factor-a protein [Panus rudis PR-1116 ss-1]|nr:replication factor-a protein [Panus rudis PR-1116 ss-1]